MVAAGLRLFLLLILIRHIWFVSAWPHYRIIAAVWTVASIFASIQWGLSWLERPYTVDSDSADYLRQLKVTVNVPVYNEEPIVLDRVVYALFSQTRLPDRVEVVDDGSRVDYSEIRDYWLAHHPDSVEFSWVCQENQGKKLTQATTFATDSADIFITLDSDTTLTKTAIEEGLTKPFANQRVQSVARRAWNWPGTTTRTC